MPAVAPEGFPELARSLGKGTREFRRGASEEADALRDQSELPEGKRSADLESTQAEQRASAPRISS